MGTKKAMLRGMNASDLQAAERLLKPFIERVLARPYVNEKGERSIYVRYSDEVGVGPDTQLYSLTKVKETIEGIISNRGDGKPDDDEPNAD